MADLKHPVLFIHGIDDTACVFDAMMAYLSNIGWSALHAIDLTPNNGDVGLEQLAAQVKSYGDKHLVSHGCFDLVGFSMGGIVARYYVQKLGGARWVRRFISLSSPHRGTWTGYLRWNRAAEQMRPRSLFLKGLNDTIAELNAVDVTSVWTPLDLMIIPASSSELPVGRTLQLPIWAHPLMLSDRRVLEAVAHSLSTEY